MSELIRRDDALKAIEARAYDLESTDSINTAYGCRLGGDVVRALPAIGTCKDCAYSGARRNWRGFVYCQLGPRQADAPMDTESANYGCFPAHLYVHPDHYCAAFRRRPDNA